MRTAVLLNKVTAILEEASGIEMTGVTPEMSFLEIGLDTLLLARVSTILHEEFGLPITLRQLNEEYTTLAQLTSYLNEMMSAEALVRAVAPTDGPLGAQQALAAAALLSLDPPSPAALAAAYHTLNATDQPYPADQTLQQLLEDQACTTPHHTAVQFGATVLSYQELQTKANQLAQYFIAQGVQIGDRIGLAVDRSPDLVIALLASLKCGATYVPLDPVYPPGRLKYMLTDSGAKFLLASTPGAIITEAKVLLLAESMQAAAHYPVQEPALTVASTQPAYIFYTSGSTGQPKGVAISHRNLINFLCSMRQTPGISASDRLLAITTISFDIAGLEIFLPLVSGATIVLVDALTAKDGPQLLRILEEEKITIMQATPSSWRMMLEAGWDKMLPLKVLCGGEALSQELAGRLLARSQSVWNMYGPTETTIWSSVKQLAPTDTVISIGHPIANTQFYLLNEHGQLVAPGEVGELCIAGDGVARGYWQRLELTTEKFIANPFSSQPHAKLYRTGDLGQLLSSGELQCLGRIDQQLKIRGHRIEPGEVEHALMALDGVQEAVVIACESHLGDERLVAFVVPATSTLPVESKDSAKGWKRALRRTLPEYMVPSEVVLVARVPLTLNGKIDQKALRKQFIATNTALDESQYVAPRTDMERLVATIWQVCLGLPQVSILDNFFELGGNSLLAVQVMASLKKETGQHLPLATLLESPTIEQLASKMLRYSEAITWNSLVPIKPQGSKVPLYIVHGAGLNILIFNALFQNMDVDQPVYGLQAKGLSGQEEPLETIEAMAAHYIAAIMQINSTGPYALAGYSFGGIIAYEMTKQLIAAGKEVKFLGMFDTYADQSDFFDPWPRKVWNRSRFLIKKVAFDLSLLKNNPKTVGQAKIKSLQRRTLERLKHGKEQLYEKEYGHSYKLVVAQKLACRHYRLIPQPIAVHLFRSKEKTFYMEDSDFLGWKPFAQAGVTVYDFPGDHNFVFAPPDDKEAVAILQQALNDTLS